MGISQFSEGFMQSAVNGQPLDEGYQAMSADRQRKSGSVRWCNALSGNAVDAS